IYELQIAKDRGFQDAVAHTIDSNSMYSYQDSGPRYWRVRAKVNGEASFSDWSSTITTTYYPTAFSRILRTNKLIIYVSTSLNQSIFKFVNGQGQFAGADVEIGKAIARKLADKHGRKIQPTFWPVAWPNLLGSLRADSTQIGSAPRKTISGNVP